MISFSSPSIFHEATFNTFLGENTIPGTGFCSFKYFLESLEIRFLSPFLWPNLTLPWFLAIEIRFRKRLFKIDSFKKIRYNYFSCLLIWQIMGFVERGRFGIRAQLFPWSTVRLRIVPHCQGVKWSSYTNSSDDWISTLTLQLYPNKR